MPSPVTAGARVPLAWRAAPGLIALVGVALARVAGPTELALGGALAAVAAAGVAATGWSGIPFPAIERIAVGFLVGVALAGAVALVLYTLAPPVEVALAALAVVLSIPVSAWAARPPLPVPARVRPHVAAVISIALAVAAVVAVAGPYFPPGWDGPFHAATLRRLIESDRWMPPDPYFAVTPLPVPQYGLDPWYPVLALASAVAGRDALETIRHAAPALSALAVVSVFAMTRAAASRSGSSRDRATPTWAGLIAVALFLAFDGAVRAAFPLRSLLLPETVATLVLLPAALTALWWSSGSSRRGLVLVAAAAALVASVHLVAGAVLGVVFVAEIVARVAAAIVRRPRAPRGAARADDDMEEATAGGDVSPARGSWPVIVAGLIGLLIALLIALPGLLALTGTAGPFDYGSPAFARHLGRIGPFVFVRPSVVFGDRLVLLALAGALLLWSLTWRAPGARALAVGVLLGPLVTLFPPLATAVAGVASTLYLRRLASVPAELAVPVLAVTAALVIDRLLSRKAAASRSTTRAHSRRVVSIGVLATTALALALAVATVGLARSGPRAPPPWVRGGSWPTLFAPDDADTIRALADALAPYIPPGSTVLSDAVTSYRLPAVLDLRVVAVPPIHSLSADPARVSIRGATAAGQDVRRFLAGSGSRREQEAVIRRYGVDLVVVLRPSRSASARFERRHREVLRLVASGLRPVGAAVYEPIIAPAE